MLALGQQVQDGDVDFRCATDQKYEELVKANPQILIQRDKMNAFIKEYIKNNPTRSDDQVYIIPVVFHVVHQFGNENVTYEFLQQAIDQMNLDYRLQRPDTTDIIPEMKPIAGDARIEFRLARKDPNGNCTMGVTRVYSETTNGGGEMAKYADPSWDNSKYLNVWVVNALESGVAGWSYYPGTASDEQDGVILLYDYLKRALTHEVGHFLNLAHPWGSTNDPGYASNCDIDDDVDDTPNTVGHTSCDLRAFTCGSLDNVQNFMEYSYCYKMFTKGQGARMRATLNYSASHRNNLWTEQNLIATGTNDGYVDEVCAPIAEFKVSKKLACTGSSVHYNDYTYNTSEIDYRLWTFDGGEPSTSQEENPDVVYNYPGNFSSELYVENSTESSSVTSHDTLHVYDKTAGYTVPYVERFETSTFPRINGNDGNDFYVESYDNNSWKTNTHGYSGRALRINNTGWNAHKKSKVYLPNVYIDEENVAVEISFKIACAVKTGGHSDLIKIYSSNDCGESLRLRYSIMGSPITSTYMARPENFIPDNDDDWRELSFTIPASQITGQNLRLVFESEKNGDGSVIYIDDVSYSYKKVSSIDNSELTNISVYPNPFADELYIDVADEFESYNIEIFNVMGQMIYSGEFSEQVVNLGDALTGRESGIYFMKIFNDSKCKTMKILREY